MKSLNGYVSQYILFDIQAYITRRTLPSRLNKVA